MTSIRWVVIGIKIERMYHKRYILSYLFVGVYLPPLVRGGGKTVGFDGGVVKEV